MPYFRRGDHIDPSLASTMWIGRRGRADSSGARSTCGTSSIESKTSKNGCWPCQTSFSLCGDGNSVQSMDEKTSSYFRPSTSSSTYMYDSSSTLSSSTLDDKTQLPTTPPTSEPTLPSSIPTNDPSRIGRRRRRRRSRRHSPRMPDLDGKIFADDISSSTNTSTNSSSNYRDTSSSGTHTRDVSSSDTEFDKVCTSCNRNWPEDCPEHGSTCSHPSTCDSCSTTSGYLGRGWNGRCENDICSTCDRNQERSRGAGPGGKRSGLAPIVEEGEMGGKHMPGQLSGQAQAQGHTAAGQALYGGEPPQGEVEQEQMIVLKGWQRLPWTLAMCFGCVREEFDERGDVVEVVNLPRFLTR